MDDLTCGTCHEHIGWMTDCGPRGWVYCDSCKEKEDSEKETEQ